MKSILDIYKDRIEFRPFTHPIIGNEYKFRAYVTSEEKQLLIAKATGDEDVIQEAVIELIKVCSNIPDPKKLPKAVLAEIAKFLRTISYSSLLTFTWKCDVCKMENDNETLDLSDQVFVPTERAPDSVTIKDGTVKIVLRHITLEDEEIIKQIALKDLPTDYLGMTPEQKKEFIATVKKNDVERLYSEIAMSIDKIVTKNETFSDLHLEEKKQFIEVMPKDDLQKIIDALKAYSYKQIILMKPDCVCQNKECSTKTDVYLGRTLKSFFEF